MNALLLGTMKQGCCFVHQTYKIPIHCGGL